MATGAVSAMERIEKASSAISEIVTVLCDGAVLAQGTLDEVQADERVIEVYLGR